MRTSFATPAARRTANVAVAVLLILASVAVIVPSAGAVAAGSAAIDGTPGAKPTIVSASFLDTDANGRFDRVQIHFTANTANTANDGDDDDKEPVIETVRPQDFEVSGHVIKGCITANGLVCTATSVDDDQDGGTTPARFTVTLLLQESLDYATGGTLPTVKYTAGTIVDIEGEALVTVSSVTTRYDRADPLFAAAYGKAGENKVIARFSETVSNIPATAFPPLVTSGDAALDEGDVCFQDGGGSDQEPSGFTVSGKVGTITMAGVTASDSNNLQAADINKPIATASIGFGNADGSGGTTGDCDDAALYDSAARNLPPAGDTPGAGARPIHDISLLDGAFVTGVFSDVGSNRALVIFNGPVSSPSGGAFSHPGVFEYVNNFQSGATGIKDVHHVAGSNVVELELFGVVVANDLTSDKINIVKNKVAAAGDTDNLLDDDITGLSIVNSAVPAVTDMPNLGHSRLTVHPTVAATVDSDVNGKLDAVLVFFSAEVDPTSFGANADWSVRQLQGTAVPKDVTIEGVMASGNCPNFGAALPAVQNGVYLCLDENDADGPFGTGVEFVVGNNGALTDKGAAAINKFANLRAIDNARPVLEEYHTQDEDDDGQIDHLKLIYSEPMDDDSFLGSEFTAIDFGADAMFQGGDDVAYAVASAADTGVSGDIDDDNMVFLELVQSGTPDTEVIPQLKFARAGGLMDANGIAAANFDMTNQVADEQVTDEQLPADPFDLDRALPVIVSAKTKVGTTSMLVQFSENVWNAGAMPAAPGGNLVFGDFVWDNNNNAGASGINKVEHTAGTDTATLTIDNPITSDDFSGDEITTDIGSVFDHVGNAAATSDDQIRRAFTALDGPEIVQVRTLDLDSMGPSPGFARVLGTPDGWIDGLELTFTEPLQDAFDATCNSNLDVSEWTVKLGTHTVPTADLFVTSDIGDRGTVDCDATETGGALNDGKDDAKIFLFFKADRNLDINVAPDGWRTDATPTVIYTPDSVNGFLRAFDDGAGVSGFTKAAVDGAGPVIVLLSGSVDSDVATVGFSEAVEGSGAGGKLIASDFIYSNLATGGATAVATVTHTAGTATAGLTFNADVSGTDFTTDTLAFASTVTDVPGIAAPTPVPIKFKDLSAPTVEKIETVDNDSNGRIDHLKVSFSEPIDDGGAGCPNLAHTATGNPWTIKLGTTTLVPLSIGTDVLGGCTPSTSNQVLYIQLNTGISNAEILHTGAKPVVSYDHNAGNALIKDFAAQPNKLGAVVQLVSMDKVRPVLLSATGAVGSMEAATQDLDRDGKIDAYKLIFSEPVKDSTFRVQEWLVADSAQGDAHVISGLDTGTVPDDATVFLPFTEGADFDTEEIPGLTYVNSLGFTDLVGNRLATLNTAGAITEVDGAAPVIVNLATGNGLTIAEIEFSEPVGRVAGTPPTGDLQFSDFTYVNGNGVGVGGISGANFQALGAWPPTHPPASPSGEKGTLTFDKPVQADDMTADAIAPLANAIRDWAGNAAPDARISLNGQIADRTPPTAISDLALEAGEQSLKLTWTTPTATDLDKFDIRISEAVIDKNNFDQAHKVTAGTLGDAVTLPNPASGSSQSLTVTGLDETKTYHFAIKTIDDAGNAADISNVPSAKPDAPDGGDPADITDLASIDETSNSITVEWTAPGDDGNTGTVTSYEVKVSTSDIGTDAAFDAADDAQDSFDPATLAAAGSKQKATITGLDADTTYFVSVRAVDDKGNTGGFDTISAKTDAVDTTAPTGTLAVTSSTHQENVETDASDVTFSWSGLTDDDSTITYHYVLDQVATTTVSSATSGSRAGSTTGTTANFNGVPAGTWHFHVAGISQGGASATVHYTVIIKDSSTPVVTPDDIKAANLALLASLTVTPDGDNNILTWTLPQTSQEIAGVQIWRANSPFVEIADLLAGSAAFQAAKFTDVDAPAGSKYLVTVYFLSSAAGGKVADVDAAPGFDDKSDEELQDLGISPKSDSDSGMPWWGWLLIALGVLVLIILIVALVLAARRRGGDGEESWDDTWDDDADADEGAPADTWDDEADDAWDEDEAWDEPAAAQVPGDAAEPGVYELECPKCDHEFTARGSKPLSTTCPNCGVKGVLN